MVHIAPDSRLLVSLIKQEQAYAAQLHNLLNTSGTSLSALAIYASSSSPTVSPVLNGVADAFSGADEALRAYGEALNDWIDQLGHIKQKEEEVANIVRDREILVTRLLKVSQKAKYPSSSLGHTVSDGSSSASFSTFNSKINNAQADLQACESNLTDKTFELENIRIYAITQGLKRRCGALIQCGRVWDDMGRRAVDMLDGLDGAHPPPNGHVAEFFKPLPDLTHDHDRNSVRSSLSPSQSASQIGAVSLPAVPLSPDKHYLLDIPPPHLMSDTAIPKTSRSEGSSSSEDEGPLEVHENPRFKFVPSLNGDKNTRATSSSPVRRSPVPFPGPSPNLRQSIKLSRREGKRVGLLGNIAALFRTSIVPKSGSPRDGAWNTRTDHNLRDINSDGERSSHEEYAQSWSGRLQKGKTRAISPAVDGEKTPSLGDGDMPSHTSDSVASATVRKKFNRRLSGSGIVRSTVSEPPPGARIRAGTLGVVPAAPVRPKSGVRARGRTTSLDGSGGLTDAKTDIASMQMWKPAKGTGDSLMKIVEAPLIADPSSRLEVVRAPGSTVTRLPLLVHPPPPVPASSSAPSSPVVSKIPTNKRASLPVPTTTTPGLLVVPPPAVTPKPLRSAMRKFPSPWASPSAQAATDEKQSLLITPLSLPPASSLPRPRPVSSPRREVPSTIIESPRQSLVDPVAEANRQSLTSTKSDDSASISSYETGHENLEDETVTDMEQVPAHASAHPAPQQESEKVSLPPTQGSVLHATGSLDQHELSSTASTDTTAPARRKSVRMSSLPPQVSATPPALDDYADVDRSPWGNSPQQLQPNPGSVWQSRILAREETLSWEDSSSEDELYKAARKALSRVDVPEKKTKR